MECLHRYLFETASEITRHCVNEFWDTDTKDPFGGAMVLIIGDKHQTLPITKVSVLCDVSLAQHS
jgi:hypothetical protein